MKTLVAYFSLSGNTKKAAEKIQAVADGDFFEIKSGKDYGSYIKAIAIAGKEIMTSEMPPILNKVENFEGYDRILLGFPMWYWNCPPLIRTFVTQYDFNGKGVYPFCTSSSTGASKLKGELEKICKGAKVHEAIRIVAQTDDEIKSWLEK
ncbi:MAG: NAD(P)H-dependent oxidoreductase [Phascolarctobacterium sp.]|nr:NAD(P)H-dependent oxidoreductase [Phascolarctobacterium sp.]